MQKDDRKIGRREALAMLGASGAALTLGCGAQSPTKPTTTTTTVTTTGGSTAGGAGCVVTPSETIGPYPSLVDLFRNDIREGKSGTQLDLTITVVNTAASCSERAQTYLSRDANHRCERTGEVHDRVSRLVSGTGDPHSRGSDTKRTVAQSHSDRIPGWGQRGSVRQRRLRVARNKSDNERQRRHLRRQSEFRARERDRKSVERIRRGVCCRLGGVVATGIRRSGNWKIGRMLSD